MCPKIIKPGFKSPYVASDWLADNFQALGNRRSLIGGLTTTSKLIYCSNVPPRANLSLATPVYFVVWMHATWPHVRHHGEQHWCTGARKWGQPAFHTPDISHTSQVMHCIAWRWYSWSLPTVVGFWNYDICEQILIKVPNQQYYADRKHGQAVV